MLRWHACAWACVLAVSATAVGRAADSANPFSEGAPAGAAKSADADKPALKAEDGKAEPSDPHRAAIDSAFELPRGVTLTPKQEQSLADLRGKYETSLRAALERVSSADEDDRLAAIREVKRLREQIKSGIQAILRPEKPDKSDSEGSGADKPPRYDKPKHHDGHLSDAERRRIEDERRRLENERRRHEDERRHREHEARRRHELEEYRHREEAARKAESDRQREKAERAKREADEQRRRAEAEKKKREEAERKAAAEKKKAEAASHKKDSKKDPPKKDPPKKDPPKKDPPKKDPPKKDAGKPDPKKDQKNDKNPKKS